MRSNWLQDYSLLIFDKIDSTNLEAKRLIDQNAKGSFVIQAHEQLYGIGSNNRSWESPVGNLYISILLPTAIKMSRKTQICFIAALSLYQSLEDICKIQPNKIDFQLNFKWPNDILLNQKKIAGILIESVETTHGNYLIIGMGLNIKSIPHLKPENIRHFEPTSLYAEKIDHYKQKPLDMYNILDLIITNFDNLYHKWLADSNFFAIRNFWMQHAMFLNQHVVIENNNHDTKKGIMRDLSLDGALVLEKENHQLEYIYSGSLFPAKNNNS
jgi:BirA family biotin operon repressor/biotin-[acetyl-CoA-carboxylase] ligase